MKMATAKPETSAPASMPMTPGTPSTRPSAIGTTTAMIDGTIISLSAPLVEMATQLA
jgi:hypothetical protein